MLLSLHVFVSLGVKGVVGCAKSRVAAVAFDEFAADRGALDDLTVHTGYEKSGKGDANAKG